MSAIAQVPSWRDTWPHRRHLCTWLRAAALPVVVEVAARSDAGVEAAASGSAPSASGAGSTSSDVAGGAALETVARSADGSTGSASAGAGWTGWADVVPSTRRMAPGSIGSGASALSAPRETDTDSIGALVDRGGAAASSAGPIADVDLSGSVAAM
jgi:hypothetical protein